MTVSSITNKEIADYLRLEYTGMTDTEKAELSVLLNAAKAYAKGYTGLEDVTAAGEAVGTGDGETTAFALAYEFIKDGSQKIYIDGTEKTETTHYTIDNTEGTVTFVSAPAPDTVITADYTAMQIDKYEDIVIAVYILCQDMYDNRSMYAEKSNVNKTVQTILGMHCINLL